MFLTLTFTQSREPLVTTPFPTARVYTIIKKSAQNSKTPKKKIIIKKLR